MKTLKLCVTVLILLASSQGIAAAETRPNIIWIVVEDQSRHYGCYGEPLVHTPHIDRLAAEGVKFTHAMVTGPICSPARSALITGMYQTTIGAHQHRSGRGTEKIHLPDHVKLIPRYFKEAGYYTCLGSLGHVTAPGRSSKGLGKSDYNFQWDPSVYDASEWSGRDSGQPFFAQIMITGGKARAQARRSTDIAHVRVEDVQLPPYYPRHPKILEDWAMYLDTFNLMDLQVGQILDRLKQEGHLENTVLFFLTDHGVSHARGKQFCYDEGLRVPLIVHAPGRVKAGTIRDDLVAHIDVAATSLFFAGIPVPPYMESRRLFGPEYTPRAYVVSARDRADETVERIRSVRTHDFKYIRNGYPKRPHLQPNAYKDKKEIYHALRQWHDQGKLDTLQETLLLAPERASEELYDLNRDPWELKNLAAAPQYAPQLAHMRQMLDAWVANTGDQGQQPESKAMYDSDMKVYLDGMRKRGNNAHADVIQGNIDLMNTWQSQGR